MKHTHLFIIFLFCSSVLSTFASAESRVGLLSYMEGDVPNEYFVCEPEDTIGQTANCFFLNNFSRNLVPKNDTSGVMAAGSVSKGQGSFVEVTLNQLATSTHPNNFKTSQIFEFYIKLHWKGNRSGTLSFELEDNHIIKGQVVRGTGNEFDITIQSVPDLFMLSMFMPRISLAEIFGRNAYSEASDLEHDIKLWMQLLISPVLKSYFNQSDSTDIDLP
jgi:hypothetical protein